MSKAGAKAVREKNTAAFVYTDAAQSGADASQSLDSLGNGGALADAPRITEQELARLMSEARAEGMRQEAQRLRQCMDSELTGIRQQAAALAETFRRERQDYFAKVESKLVEFSLAIAARILHREAQVDHMVVAGLVKVMLEKIEHGTKATVRVHPEDALGWRQYFQSDSQIEIVEDPSLAAGGCVMQTEVGTVDMSLESQLKEVEKGFFDLLAQRPSVQ